MNLHEWILLESQLTLQLWDYQISTTDEVLERLLTLGWTHEEVGQLLVGKICLLPLVHKPKYNS